MKKLLILVAFIIFIFSCSQSESGENGSNGKDGTNGKDGANATVYVYKTIFTGKLNKAYTSINTGLINKQLGIKIYNKSSSSIIIVISDIASDDGAILWQMTPTCYFNTFVNTDENGNFYLRSMCLDNIDCQVDLTFYLQ